MAKTSLPNNLSIDNIVFGAMPLNRRFIDMTGERYGRLVVLGYHGHTQWFCLCDCGAIAVTSRVCLRRGMTKSCGCLSRETSRDRNLVHGYSGTRVYRIWSHIKSRCYEPTNVGYELYGGRGVKVCQRWMESFAAFLEDMGDPPTDKHSIDRINSDGDYTPENCRWATSTQQNRNRRNNRVITYLDKTQTLEEWAAELGIDSRRVGWRLTKGWTIRQAFGIDPTPKRVAWNKGRK